MKPFLGVNLTENKKNTTPNGLDLMVHKPSEELAAALQSSKTKLDYNEKKTQLPLILRIVKIFCWIVGVAFLLGILKAATDEDPIPLSEILQTMPELVVTGLIFIAIAAILFYLGKRKAESVIGSGDVTSTLNHLKTTGDTILADLGVPENARNVDILMFFYKEKNGEPKLTVKGNQNFWYMNMQFKIFADPQTFYLANVEGKFAFSRSDVKRIKMINKRATMNDWNKDYPFDDERYKKYGLKMDQYGVIYFKPCYILELEINGEEWGIYFPSYELPLFEALTGLKPVEE